LYKQWRHFLVNCTCELLTPIEPLNNRDGWIAFQLLNPEYSEFSMLLAYRLEDGVSDHRYTLNGLNSNYMYNIKNDDAPDKESLLSGKELSERGLPVQLPATNRACLFMIMQV
jgi:hypothetical protein